MLSDNKGFIVIVRANVGLIFGLSKKWRKKKNGERQTFSVFAVHRPNEEWDRV